MVQTHFVEQPYALAILKIRIFDGRCAYRHVASSQRRKVSRVRQSKEVSAGVNNSNLSIEYVSGLVTTGRNATITKLHSLFPKSLLSRREERHIN